MVILVAILALVLIYVSFVRQWIEKWGATPAEARARYPGDDLIVHAQGQSTRAITIHAPAEAVWPWLAQIGQGRGGFYSYDWLENLFGLDIHTADHILPECQTLAVGDEVRLGKNGPVYKVAVLEPGRALILRMPDQKTLEFSDPQSPDYYDATWGFIVEPVDMENTRLIIRGRGRANAFMGRLINHIIVPISFIMEQKMLRGIKSRAAANSA